MNWLEVAIKLMLTISIGILFCKIVDSFDEGMKRTTKSKKRKY